MHNYIGTGRFGGTVQSTAYTTAAATVANAFGAGVSRVRVLVTTDAYVTQGKSPTATTSDTYLPALMPEYITVSPGEKISAIQVATGGTLYVTEMA